MKYMRLSVTHRTDDKIQQLSNGQRLLFIDLICWSVLHETDGCVPSSALPEIVRGHQRWLQSLNRMVTVGLLQADHSPITLASLSRHSRITLRITSYERWQMVTKRKGAGQAADSAIPSRARTYAGDQTRLERSSLNRISSSLAPAGAPVRMIDGDCYRFMQGSGWVKDHGSDQAARQGDQAEP